MVKTAARQAVNLPSGNVPNEKSEKERENTKFWRATRANTNKEEEGKRVLILVSSDQSSKRGVSQGARSARFFSCFVRAEVGLDMIEQTGCHR